MNKIYLTNTLELAPESAGVSKGAIKGVAYSGGVIANHGWMKNLIIDLSTLSVAKEKTPLLRDHNYSQVAGHAKADIDKSVSFEGKIYSNSSHGREIMDLAQDGFEWEMSLGVYDGKFVEIENEEVNGIMIDNGIVLRNGVIREMSVVALGADKDTNTQVFALDKGTKMKVQMTEEQWAKFACGCGGTKDSTPEELESASKEKDSKVEDLEKQLADKQAEIDALKSEIEKAKEEGEYSAREASLTAAVKEKGIELAVEKIKAAAKSKEKTETLLSFIGDMKESKIAKSLTDKVDLSGGLKPANKDNPESIRLAALQMVKDGLATDFLDAINKVEVK